MRPILIDTDMGPDDWIAILFLAKHPDISLKGISISGTGESHGINGAMNCKRLLSLVNKETIPVAFGQANPLRGKNHFPNIMRRVIDRMMFLKLPQTKVETEGLYSIELLRREIENSTEKISILAIGPLTNLAKVIQKHKTLVNKIDQIILMGGAIDVPGNIKDIRFFSKNEWAEWNIYCDPYAANIVFRSGIPIVLVPLDATNEISVDQNFVNNLSKRKSDPAAIFASKILQRLGSRVNQGTYFLWDVIAAAVMINKNIAYVETKSVYVEEKGISIGRTTINEKKGTPIGVCTKVNKEKFTSMVLNSFSN